MTDSQTDRQKYPFAMTMRSTWWGCTAFNDEIDVCLDSSKWPDYVKKVYGGVEVCPTSGRRHFQGAIQCGAQQRGSAIKAFLPTSKLWKVNSIIASKQYAMKADTAEGTKAEVANPNYKPVLNCQAICLMIAQYAERDETDTSKQFWSGVNNILMDDDSYAGQLMNPSLRNWWIHTAGVWLGKARANPIVLRPRSQPDFSPDDERWDCGECGKDECEQCFEREQADRA